jgi:lysozyme family protein
MTSVREIAEAIVDREGGFVNDPADPGGATNFGVTIGTMRELDLDLDGDGDIDVADVRRMTRARAVDIFIEHYYTRPRIDALPEVLQASVFDMQVNAGANAVKILQRLVTEMGFKAVADGIIGPATLRAVRAAHEAAPDYIADAYAIARRNYYLRLADARPASRKFARARSGAKGGWIRRAEEFMSPRYRMTQAQFDRRVATWAG